MSALEARPHLLCQLYFQELRALEQMWTRNLREARTRMGRPRAHSLSAQLDAIFSR